MRLTFIVGAALALMSFGVSPHKESIVGVIKQDATRQPIPFASVQLKGTTFGTRTDERGRFRLKYKGKPDSVIISAIGFKTMTAPLSALTDTSCAVFLKEEAYVLGELIIRPGENPAHPIMRNIAAARKKNNPSNISKYRCETSTRIVVQVEKKGQRLSDTSTSTNGFTPIFFSEKQAKNTIDRSSNSEKVEIISQKQNGLGILADFQVDGYESAMSTEVNFYENKIELFGKSFYSPIGDNGLSYYKYYLKDSTIQDGRMVYTIDFKPKVKKDLAFKGTMLIDKQTWALVKIKTVLPKSANINYLTDFKIRYDFVPINDTLSFFRANAIEAELYYNKNGKKERMHKLLVNKTTSYSNVAVGDSTAPSIQRRAIAAAPSIEEVQLNHKLDSLNTLWWMRAIDKISTTAITSYFPMGPIDLGPYLDYVKHNKVEGLRLTLALRTSESFHPRYSLSGKIGYGFRDKDWKYGLGIAYKPPFEHRTIFGIDYEKDMTIIGSNDHLMLLRENTLHSGEDNLIAALTSRRPNDRLSISRTMSVWSEYEIRRGLSAKTRVEHQLISSGEFVPFTHQGAAVDKITNSSVSLQARLSFKEKTADKFLRRYYLGTKFPIVTLAATAGRYSLPEKQDSYLKLHLAYKHHVTVGLGKLIYIMEAGTIFGAVPFPLLEVHRGNETYGYTRFRFNTMNNLQLASDRYASLFAEYHMNGAIVNRLPLIRDLNIREVVSAKVLYGSLSDRHRQVLDFPEMLQGVSKPFVEVGGGFENILNFFRIEGVYRVSPQKLPHVPRFEVKARFQVDF